MQTIGVHMRSPLKLLRELGPRGFLGMQLIIGGTVLAALVHPVFLVALFASVLLGYAPWQSESDAILIALYFLNLFAGYLGSGVLGFIGLSRRCLQRTAWVLLLIPLHWLLCRSPPGAPCGNSSARRSCGKRPSTASRGIRGGWSGRRQR